MFNLFLTNIPFLYHLKIFSRSIEREHWPYRSSHRGCSIRKDVLKNFKKFTEKHLCQSLFFNKVAGQRPATLLKKRLWRRCFPVNFENILRTPFLQNNSHRLRLVEIILNQRYRTWGCSVTKFGLHVSYLPQIFP